MKDNQRAEISVPQAIYHNRRAFRIENELLRLTMLAEGGHVAEILHKGSGANPMWTPPWTSIEPSSYRPAQHPEYGLDAESSLLAGIMGHSLCLDIFGGPSEAEAAAGMPVHGEASVAQYEFTSSSPASLTARAVFPQAQLRFERRILLAGSEVLFAETVENLTACDRPIGWTQHVTLGPPFLVRGATRFELTATRSKVYETDFSRGKGHLIMGAEFDWPYAPRLDGSTEDLRIIRDVPASAAYTAHLMDPAREEAEFTAHSPASGVTFGYRWKRIDFPWLGIWEENHSRDAAPWNGRTLARGMEFGVSPMPEPRRQMIERPRLFGAPVFRWIPARQSVTAEYRAFFR